MAFILGVDVHAGYDAVRPIDWHAAKAAGVEFAIAKCSLGNDPPGDDRSFRRNVAGAKASGVLIGAYHFGFPLPVAPGVQLGRAPREQAERAWRVSGELGGQAGELPPALDLEWPPHYEHAIKGDPASPLVDRWKEWRITDESIVEWSLEYLSHIETLSGRTPLVYTYPDFAANLAGAASLSELARYPLWIASYPRACAAAWVPGDGLSPSIPAPWETWAIWQFAADNSPMRIPGISACPIDRDVFNGERGDLMRLAGIHAPASLSDAPTVTNLDEALEADRERYARG